MARFIHASQKSSSWLPLFDWMSLLNKWLNNNQLKQTRCIFLIRYCSTTSNQLNQKEATSRTISGWQVFILATHFDHQKLGDFNFFEDSFQAIWMDFWLRGMGRNMNLSAFLLLSLKAERCDFLGKNCSGAGAFQKIDSTLVLLLKRNSKRLTKKLSKSLKYPCWGKDPPRDDNIPQVK